MKLALIAVVCSVSVILVSPALASTGKTKGRDAVLFSRVLNQANLTQGDASKGELFGGAFDPKSCSSDTGFKKLIVRVQSGRIDCRYSDKTWDLECYAYNLAGSQRETFRDEKAWMIQRILSDAGVKPKTENGERWLHATALDCNFKGFEVCMGNATCNVTF